MTDDAIAAECVELTYADGTQAVRGIDLTVPRGEFFGFLGPNGAGKTTTIKTLVTLLRPTAGTITVNGFDALREALRNRHARQLIQASQDVLTLLSQDGIYMDDLNPDMARPDVWRMFAHGVRGRQIAALGGVRDRSSLALAAGRMREDPIFRDAVHHFLRRFDKSFAQFESEASDAEISELAGTRTARAFMLLGRVAGVFD